VPRTYRQEVHVLNGVAALAATALWIAYLVPHRLRHRQQLLESRAEDRFSGALRVLAVTDSRGRELRAGEARGECRPGGEKRSGLFAPDPAIGVQGYRIIASGGRVMDRPHGTQDKLSADAARRIAQRRSQRAAMLARRSAAARRRAALALVLLVASAGAWVVVGISTLAVIAAVVPSVLLTGVLVLGRRAVIHGHAADAAWNSQHHAADGVRSVSARTSSGPVVGRAQHPSDAMTEVIARVRDDAPSGSYAVVSLDDAADGEPEKVESATVHEEWSPVPVPRPTYTTKAEAPRRGPVPLVLDDPRVAAAVAMATTSSAVEQVDAPNEAGDLEPAASTPDPTLDLDAILARRRNVG